MNAIEFPKNRWYPILESKKLKLGSRPVSIRRLGKTWVLWRSQKNAIHGLEDICPHRGAKLSLGKTKGDQIECPYHGFRFSGSGECTDMPACGPKPSSFRSAWNASSVTLAEKSGFIWLWWAPAQTTEAAIPRPLITWEDAFGPVAKLYPPVAIRSLEVPLPFLRMVESHLDVYHSAFVHRFPLLDRIAGAIPSLKKLFISEPVVDEIEVIENNHQILLKGVLKSAKNGKNSPHTPFTNWMIYPNQTGLDLPNWKSRAAFVSCPIDQDSTWFAGLWSQNYCTIPLLSRFLNWMSLKRLLGAVWKQDERVLLSQSAFSEGLKNDRLIHADAGIVAFRKIFLSENPRSKTVEKI